MWLNVKQGERINSLRLSDIAGFKSLNAASRNFVIIEANGLSSLEYVLNENESFQYVVRCIKGAMETELELT